MLLTIVGMLEELYGKTDWISPELFFDQTRYYADEMGWPLHRRFVSFEQLISPEQLVAIKLQTNRLENQHLSNGKRRINIDPGYISAERLILATGKNFSHRVYLSRGVFADLTLIFQKGRFKILEWTYPDYATPEILKMLNRVRDNYLKQLKNKRSASID